MDNLRKIVFVAGSREVVLPVTPSAFEVGHGIKIETINIHGVGDIRVAGYTTLDNVSISSFFPAQAYSFAVAEFTDPWDLVAQLKAWADAQTVLRFIVTGTDINIPALVENIRYGEKDGSNDVYYTLSLAEYRYVSTSRSSTRSTTAKTSRAITTAPVTPKTHTVATGDTLRAIARKYYGDSSKYTAIASANNIKNANLIYPGTVLTLLHCEVGMNLYLGGVNVTQLAADISTSGSGKECSRTLKASIVQSPMDKNLPSVSIRNGMPVVLQADGQYFVGVVMSFSRSTASNKIDFTAKDLGIYVKKNKVTFKAKNLTPEAAAADLCAQYGVPVGSLAATGFLFSRNYMGVTLYDAIMTGYSLAAATNGKKYMLIMEGTAVSVVERGGYIAAAIVEGENLMEAAYSESIESMINQVDIIDKDGKLVQSVTGDTSYGIMRDQITLTDKEDGVAKAEQVIRDNGLSRNGSVRNIGNAACVSGAAVLIRESFTGLWGKFWIESDNHNWKNGVYTNALTLAFENSMDNKSAGQAMDVSKKSSAGKGLSGLIAVGYTGEPYEDMEWGD